MQHYFESGHHLNQIQLDPTKPNNNRTTPHFGGYMRGVVYKTRFEWFEVSIFFKFWPFPTQSKIDFSLYFGPSFKLLS